MAINPDATRVIFRRWPDREGGDVVALLLDVPANPGRTMMYQHVGQHGEGSAMGVVAATRPATVEEYAPLKRELEQRGYVVIVRQRWAPRKG